MTQGHRKMLSILQQIGSQTSEQHNYIGSGVVRRLRARLAATSAETPMRTRWQLHMQLGAGELRLGNEQEAIGQFTQAVLYRGNGKGGFVEVAEAHNLVRPNSPMGSNFGDLDNDGYLDFYLGTGNPELKNLMPGVMYLNKGGTHFADVSYAGGFAHIQKGHGVIFADLDNDGDSDIFEQMGGAFLVDKYSNVLYENEGFGNHWLTIKLVGVRSNRSAIGARIRVEVVENGRLRSIYRHVNSGGSFGANPLRQTIGLGKASKIETLEVFWPTSGIKQTFHNIPNNQFIQITEGEAQAKTFIVQKLKLGGE